MTEDRDHNAEQPDTDAMTGAPGSDRTGSGSWRSHLPWEAVRKARLDRDRALSERDAARRALKAARRNRDAAVAELAKKQAELDAVRAQLERGRSDSQKTLNDIHTLTRRSERAVRSLHAELITDTQALHQLLSRYSPQARLPAVAGWALSPTGLLALVELIETRGAKTVVECGSGTSTLWIGFALRRLGSGRVIALDHLAEYAEKTRAAVVAHGLEEFVDVRHAPLAPCQTPRGEFSWYSVDLAEITAPIDVLLVDGPPRAVGSHARYPALSVFTRLLAPDAVIVADDTDRHDEKEMLDFWLEEEPRLRRVESPGPGVEVLSFTG